MRGGACRFILFTLIDRGLATHLLALALPATYHAGVGLMADTNPTLIRLSLLPGNFRFDVIESSFFQTPKLRC